MTPPLFYIKTNESKTHFFLRPCCLADIQCLFLEEGKEGAHPSSGIYGVHLAGLCRHLEPV